MTSANQPIWSGKDGRYLMRHYDENSRRYYYNCFHDASQQWAFFKWARPDSVIDNEAQTVIPAQTVRPAGWRVGPTVEGTYNVANPVPNTHFEGLDPSYYVRGKDFFKPGRVFSVLFTEAAGSTLMHNYQSDAITIVKYGERAHTQIRRFIVVRQKREFCYAVPIFTYKDRGTLKSGVVPSEHAIAYTYGYQPTLVPGEKELEKDPICIVSTNNNPPLKIASRIYFGIQHPIQYNIKAKELGYVTPVDLVKLERYWAMEQSVNTSQGAEDGE